MCRATWYRRGKPALNEISETNSNAVPSFFPSADEIVSPPVLKSPLQAPPEAPLKSPPQAPPEASGRKAVSASRSLPAEVSRLERQVAFAPVDTRGREGASLSVRLKAFRSSNGRLPTCEETDLILDQWRASKRCRV
jgi:hypothetical protein